MKIVIKGGRLHLIMSRLEQIFAVRKTLSVPTKNLKSVSHGRPEFSLWEFRAPGAHLPHVIKTGTYYTLRGKEFWYVRRGEHPVTIDLKDHELARLVVSFRDPDAVVKKIKSAIK